MGALVILAMAFSFAASAQTDLQIAYPVDPTGAAEDAILQLNRELSRLSGGQVTTTATPVAAGSDREVTRMVYDGIAQIGFIPIRVVAELNVDFTVFDVPFLLSDLDVVDAFASTDEAADMVRRLRDYGLVGLGYLHQDMRDLVGSGVTADPDDLQGAGIAVTTPVDLMPFDALGARSQRVAPADVDSVISRGAVSVAEMTSSTIAASDVLRDQDRLIISNHSYEGWLLVANRDWFESLPLEVRENVSAIADITLRAVNERTRDSIQENLVSLGNTIGEIVVLDSDQREQWRGAMASGIEQYEDVINPDIITAARRSNFFSLSPTESDDAVAAPFDYPAGQQFKRRSHAVLPWDLSAAGTQLEYTPVQLLFGTDRRNEGTLTEPQFGGGRHGELQLGTIIVTVPKGHVIGEIERPAWWLSWTGILGQEEVGEHFVMQEPVLLLRDDFIADLRSLLSRTSPKHTQAFVFVHGFNVTFAEAAWRTAQIAHDLEFDGAPIFYSWPSRGDVEDYPYDRDSARQARDTLEEFLNLVRTESGAEVIHLIGHSMGTNPLMEVVVDMWDEQRHDRSDPLFHQVILAAADIDRDVFLDLARQIEGAAHGLTLYSSARDVALKFSRSVAGGVPRVGDVPEQGPVLVPSVDTIDATELATEFFSLKHSEYADNPILLKDMKLLMAEGLRPPKLRTKDMNEISTENGVYWQYLPP